MNQSAGMKLCQLAILLAYVRLWNITAKYNPILRRIRFSMSSIPIGIWEIIKLHLVSVYAHSQQKAGDNK